jgi:hypothetical protein
LESDGAASVDVFAVLREGADAGTKYTELQAGWNFSSIDQLDEGAVWSAVASLRPRIVVRERRTRLAVNPRCRTTGHVHEYIDRVLPQPSAWATCFEEIEKVELEDGTQYDWVVRARPDAYWFTRHPPLPRTPALILPWNLPLDQHFCMPRVAARTIFAGMAERYAECRGELPFPFLEVWLLRTVNATASQLGLEVVHMPFGLVLVRNSSHEPSAKILCQGLKKHGFRSERGDIIGKERCLREAYPGEDLGEDAGESEDASPPARR